MTEYMRAIAEATEKNERTKAVDLLFDGAGYWTNRFQSIINGSHATEMPLIIYALETVIASLKETAKRHGDLEATEGMAEVLHKMLDPATKTIDMSDAYTALNRGDNNG